MAKRKQNDEESLQEDHLHHDGQLEMLSEEGIEDLVSDDSLVDDFPELNVQRDSDGSETGYSTAEDDDDSAKNGDGSLVYPEIEPDYDSDSSTEDVSSYYLYKAC